MSLIALIPACRTAQPAKPAAPTRVDYLIEKYDELRSGRFAILADFEDPGHRQLAQVIGVSSHAACTIQEAVGTNRPGENSLAFHFATRDDTLAISNEQATDWYLKLDWSGYDLFLFAVETPQPGLTLNLTIAAGQPGARNQVHSTFPLEHGANTLRIDLAELAEKIPLDDVRAILVSVSGATAPTRVLLDDLLLTGNSTDLLGDSSTLDGRLYVRRSGLRHKVGAGGRFELTFANGQVVEYFDLHADPSKLNNLVRGTTLGPMPIMDDDEGIAADPSKRGYRVTGSRLATTQRVLEMNEVRVIVECDWRFSSEPRIPLDARPFHRWRYAIYPTGQVYVALAATTRTPAYSIPGLSWAVGLAPPPDSDVIVFDPRRESRSMASSQQPCAALVTDNNRVSFFYVPNVRSPSSEPGSMTIRHEPDSGFQTILTRAEVAAGEATRMTAVFYLSPWSVSSKFDLAGNEEMSDKGATISAVDSEPFAAIKAASQARARAYVSPPIPLLELGRFHQPADQPVDQGPFDRALGQYAVTPDRGRVRLLFDNRETPAFAPAIEVLDSADQEAWVYVNHLILKSVARNEAGNIVFQLPADIPRRAVVEALLRPK